jgi:hypothetical protein
MYFVDTSVTDAAEDLMEAVSWVLLLLGILGLGILAIGRWRNDQPW